MADQDELRLRIVPELDDEAVKRIKAQLDALYGGLPPGGPPPTKPQGDPQAPARKQELADIRAKIDLIDLTLRKETAASARRQQILEQEGAQSKRSLQETAQLIAQEENLRENATASAIQGFDRLEQELTQLNSTQQDVINRQKQLFFASERAKNGFTTMSGSMTTLTSNTKSANIAFANFGRIVQDAPFGLLGISNNIDPLLNSFAQLKTETGGAGAAFAAMGKQLLGPAGLIFLAGSLLPTALLFLQKHLRDNKKESDDVADAIERVRTELAKLSAEAAAEKGLDQLNEELAKNATTLAEITKAEEALAAERTANAQLISAQTLGAGRMQLLHDLDAKTQLELARAEKEKIAEKEKSIAQDRQIIQANTNALTLEKAQIESRIDITDVYAKYGTAAALAEKTTLDARTKAAEAQKLLDIQEANRISQRTQAEQALSKIFDTELQQRIKDERASVRELLKNTELKGDEKIRLEEYYNGIEDRLTKEHNARMLAEQRENAAKSLAEKKRAAEQKQKQQEQDDAKELQKEREKQSILAMIEQDKIALMFARGQTIKAIEAEEAAEKLRITAEYDRAEATGLITNKQRVAGEKAAIDEAELSAERAKMDARVQMGNMAANAVIGGLSAAFGQSKGVKAAEVAVQSITAAYEAFSSMQAQFGPGLGTALGTAAAAGILAKGRQSIKEIYATKPGSRGASSSGASSSPSAPSAPKFVNDMGAAGQVAGTIGPFGASMTPSISITANLDRQGLALAVRDGESDIATRQIPFAS